MGTPNPPTAAYCTYGDYAQWDDDERWELFEGKAIHLEHGYTPCHQQVAQNLLILCAPYFDKNPGKLLMGPLDVLLPKGDEEDDRVDTVLQPDLMVVCDPERIKKKYILGAPDLVIEVLSEASAGRDLSDKMFFYENHDVRCYITANPWSKSLTVQYRAASGRKFGHPATFAGKDQMPIRIFDGLVIDLEQVFENVERLLFR